MGMDEIREKTRRLMWSGSVIQRAVDLAERLAFDTASDLRDELVELGVGRMDANRMLEDAKVLRNFVQQNKP
jgi:hypothetical protein